jgi:predicted nucleic acid-binding protein
VGSPSVIPGALSGVRVLAIDSAPLIYLVERHAVFGPPMEAVAEVIDAGELQLVASTLTLTEVLTQPLRLGRREIAAAYQRILQSHPLVRLIPLDTAIAASAADLRARYHLRTPDAIQIATAMVGWRRGISNKRPRPRARD